MGLCVDPLEDLAEGAFPDGFSDHVTITTDEDAMHLVLVASSRIIVF